MNSTNCVLIGFMGSGKSTIAKALCQANEAFALDSDLLISYQENLSITEIFTTKGEAYFRELESKFCSFVAQNFQHTIIATGGGMPMFCDVKKMGKDKDSAFKLYNARLEAYKNSAHYCINANQSVQNITQEILSFL